MLRDIRFHLSPALLALCLGACGGDEPAPPEYPPVEVPEPEPLGEGLETQDVDPALSGSRGEGADVRVTKAVQVVPGTRTPLEG